MSGAGLPYYTGLTQSQFDHLSKNYAQQGFVADPSRIGTYTNPLQNAADRNWQEVLKTDRSYVPVSASADKASWKQNCNFGPHNAGSDLDKILYSKK